MAASRTARSKSSKSKSSQSKRRNTGRRSKTTTRTKTKATAKTRTRVKSHNRAAGKKASARGARKWSGKVTETSDALDLKDGLFKGTPTQIAQSLKRAAERSHRRKSSPYRSAMSMLVFYINRAGKNLSATRRKRLETAKDKLREAFGKPAA